MKQIATAPRSPVDASPLQAALPQLSPYAARLSRLISHPYFSKMLNGAFGVKHLRVVENHDTWQARGAIVLSHQKGSAQISFDLSHYPALAIVAGTAQDHSASDGELALRQAASALLLDPVAGQLRMLGFDNPRFDSLRRASPPVTPPVAALEFEIDGTPMNIEFDASDLAFLCPFEEKLNRSPMASPALNRTLSGIRVPGFAVLGTQRLKIGTLHSLRAGDILLKGISPHFRGLLEPSPTALPLNLTWGMPGGRSLCVSGSLDGNVISITDRPFMSNDSDVFDPPDPHIEGAIDLNELEMPVRLEVDTVVLSVAKLSSLAPGYVLELPVPLAETSVRLVAYGQTVGFGELVAVGENLGLRITRMADSDDSAN